ncbi:MAG: hypothetical protein J7M21_02910, partial [Planctomycetes bacterium]|nr:hypothetical protein [Planctomycetota bacterium]
MTRADTSQRGIAQAAGGVEAAAGSQRVPPQSIQAEACVLGSMILHAPVIDVIVQMLRAEDFYRPAHQVLFNVLVEMHDAGKPIDLVTVREALQQQGRLEDVGGIDYVVAMVEGVPSAASAEYYARVVREKSMLRRLIVAGTEMVQDAFETHEDAAVVLDRAEQRVFEIATERVEDQTATMESLLT